VDFDPSVVSYEQLLELALASHDPFRVPYSRQYASLVLTHSEAQMDIAYEVAKRHELSRVRKLATRIEPLKRFYLAEDYHQKYHLRLDRVLSADFRAMFATDAAFRDSTAAARVNGYVAGDGTSEQLEREIDLLGLTDAARVHLADKVAGRSRGGACSL
jgi:peptide-methionine (S)-S-oxide reductase